MSPVGSRRSAISSATSFTVSGGRIAARSLSACCGMFSSRVKKPSLIELEERQIPVDQLPPCEEGNDPADGEERSERDRHLASRGSVSREEHDRGDERRDHPQHQRDGHRSPDRRLRAAARASRRPSPSRGDRRARRGTGTPPRPSRPRAIRRSAATRAGARARRSSRARRRGSGRSAARCRLPRSSRARRRRLLPRARAATVRSRPRRRPRGRRCRARPPDSASRSTPCSRDSDRAGASTRRPGCCRATGSASRSADRRTAAAKPSGQAGGARRPRSESCQRQVRERRRVRRPQRSPDAYRHSQGSAESSS